MPKQHKSKWRKHKHYGMVKIEPRQKIAWLAIENKYGWRLGLAIEKRTIWLRNTHFASHKLLDAFLENGRVIYVPLKKNTGKYN